MAKMFKRNFSSYDGKSQKFFFKKSNRTCTKMEVSLSFVWMNVWQVGRFVARQICSFFVVHKSWQSCARVHIPKILVDRFCIAQVIVCTFQFVLSKQKKKTQTKILSSVDGRDSTKVIVLKIGIVLNGRQVSSSRGLPLSTYVFGRYIAWNKCTVCSRKLVWIS
jgi:hypothetical protein